MFVLRVKCLDNLIQCNEKMRKLFVECPCIKCYLSEILFENIDLVFAREYIADFCKKYEKNETHYNEDNERSIEVFEIIFSCLLVLFTDAKLFHDMLLYIR